LEAAFGDQKVGGTPSVQLFFKIISFETFFEVAKHLGHPSLSRTDENVD
jgi:hypothetical protein